ncbi:cytochrome b/b6 domain-containing protein [Candidatus Sumerlaeota bacterium]|nr:cytochrome b/b6 domain-containing protein [Candidatus Sumerlaeota bacterium]
MSASYEKPEMAQRFSLQYRIQHLVLLLAVLTLIFTGAFLWFMGRPELFWWSQDFEGIDAIRVIHRIAASALIAVSLYHTLFTIFTREGRREFWLLLPRWKDVADVTQNSMYFLGLREERPKFGRYTYYEKFDYWAVYWGCVIMIGTGLVLWFDQLAASVAPWLPYRLAAEVHADEAVLATLALFVWHFYNVHFNPKKFPGSLTWLHGKIPLGELKADHPLEYESMLQEKDEAESPETGKKH